MAIASHHKPNLIAISMCLQALGSMMRVKLVMRLNLDNNTIIVKGPVDTEAASEEPSITDKPNHVTNASATNILRLKNF